MNIILILKKAIEKVLRFRSVSLTSKTHKLLEKKLLRRKSLNKYLQMRNYLCKKELGHRDLVLRILWTSVMD